MTNLIAFAVLALILGGAILFIYKEKKRGTVCIGCPQAQACAAKRKAAEASGCSGSCSGCSGQCGR